MGWRSGRAYSQDLRERVLAAVDGGMAARAVAPLFQVSIAYVYKALIRRRRSGETTARPQRNRQTLKLAGLHEAILAEVERRPDATLDELRIWLLEAHGTTASSGLMSNTLRRLGLTRKKRPAGPRSRTGPTSPNDARPGRPRKARSQPSG
jgi:transposase